MLTPASVLLFPKSYWLARDLMPCLGYTRWENFIEAIRRAETACSVQKNEVSHHFRDVTKMIDLPKGAKREIADVMLSRYACYLIAMNGDPRYTGFARIRSKGDEALFGGLRTCQMKARHRARKPPSGARHLHSSLLLHPSPASDIVGVLSDIPTLTLARLSS